VAARRTVSRPCAVMSERKLILPAFGALTGGLDAAHALLKAMQPARSITALVPTAARVAHFPLWQAAAAETAPCGAHICPKALYLPRCCDMSAP
jgi:metallophosphoesterase superfamily enzyme